MISLILSVAMLNAAPAEQTAQFKPCVWPNVCRTEPAPVVAQFETCVWPKKCVDAKS